MPAERRIYLLAAGWKRAAEVGEDGLHGERVLDGGATSADHRLARSRRPRRHDTVAL